MVWARGNVFVKQSKTWFAEFLIKILRVLVFVYCLLYGLIVFNTNPCIIY